MTARVFRKMHILIVEDNKDNAETFAQVFRSFGHEVETIGHSGKCLETLPRDFRPDRILMDASLSPALLHKVIETFSVPILGITAGDAGDLPAGIPVLKKPAEPAMVLAELEAAGGAR